MIYSSDLFHLKYYASTDTHRTQQSQTSLPHSNSVLAVLLLIIIRYFDFLMHVVSVYSGVPRLVGSEEEGLALKINILLANLLDSGIQSQMMRNCDIYLYS